MTEVSLTSVLAKPGSWNRELNECMSPYCVRQDEQHMVYICIQRLFTNKTHSATEATHFDWHQTTCNMHFPTRKTRAQTGPSVEGVYLFTKSDKTSMFVSIRLALFLI